MREEVKTIPDRTDVTADTQYPPPMRSRRRTERTSWDTDHDEEIGLSVEFDAWAEEPDNRPSALRDADLRDAPSGMIPLDDDPRDALGAVDRGRVTIDFSGPPLDLPEPPAEESPEPPPIELAEAGGPDHDAWVTDRTRRSTVPPQGPESRGSSSSSPLQHRWMSPAQAAQTSAAGDSVVGELPAADGDALELVDRSRPSEPKLDLMAEVRARYALDDLSGALQAVELVLGAQPNNAEALKYAESCRARLEQLYSSQIGSLQGIPRIAVAETDIRWLGLDHRAGFLLSRVDGMTPLEDLLDVSGMPRLEALKTVVGLLDVGAVIIDPP